MNSRAQAVDLPVRLHAEVGIGVDDPLDLEFGNWEEV